MNASEKIQELSLHDPIVKACISCAAQGGDTYTDMLEHLVILLAEEKSELQGRLIALAQRGVV